MKALPYFSAAQQVVYDDLVLYISAKTEDERKDWVDSIQDGI